MIQLLHSPRNIRLILEDLSTFPKSMIGKNTLPFSIFFDGVWIGFYALEAYTTGICEVSLYIERVRRIRLTPFVCKKLLFSFLNFGFKQQLVKTKESAILKFISRFPEFECVDRFGLWHTFLIGT